MALTSRLELRQSQSLVMTPQLQQAIKLLQLSNVELSAYIEEELQHNPLLERAENDGEDGGGAETAEESRDRADEAVAIADADGFHSMDFSDAAPTAPAEGALDVDYDNLWNNDAPGEAAIHEGGDQAFADWGHGGNGRFEGQAPNLEQTVSGVETLRDHLTGQLNVELSDPAERVIGLYLIDMLDDAGYLPADLTPAMEALQCSEARLEATVKRLQQFDPAGIFARSLSECLAIQLRERNRLDPAMQALLNHLDLLAKRDIAALQKICGVDAEDITDMVGEIRQLNPKPAHEFDHDVAQPVTPDILMRSQPGGGWLIELNTESLPRVLINNRYLTTVVRATRTREEKVYLNDCLQSANWLVKSLHQRATTILRVASEIVAQQDDFFARGVEHLRPLVLRDIAQAIEMHESTVSRVTSNKFIATPRGIYELKYFFTTAIASASGGEAHSAESVRHRIKTMIDSEPTNKVYSDDGIVEVLRAEGVEIARRTVAKYREALGIPSSVQRRRLKASGF